MFPKRGGLSIHKLFDLDFGAKVTKEDALINININLLPKINQSIRNAWPTYYDQETANIAHEIYSNDFEFFGYEKLIL